MPTRRSLLKRIGAGVSIASLGASAGCVSSFTGGGGSSAPAYADPLYDPSTVMEAPSHGFVSYDLGTLYDRRDLFPGSMASQIEQADEQFAAASLADLGRLTAEMYTTASLSNVGGGQGGSGPLGGQDVAAGGSAILEGSFKPDALVGQLRSLPQGKVSGAGSAAGHDLYKLESASSGMVSSPPATLGVSQKSIGLGMTYNTETTGKTTLTPMLEGSGDGSSGYYDADPTAKRILDGLGDVTTANGVVADIAAYTENASPSYPNADTEAVATGLQGLGSGATLGQNTVTSKVVGVYQDGSTPSKSNVQGAIDFLGQQAGQSDSMNVPTGKMTASVDGRTATVSWDVDASKLFQGGGPMNPMGVGASIAVAFPVAAVLGTFVLGIGSSRRPVAPQVSVDWTYAPDQSPPLQAVHNGGDTIEANNLQATVGGEGSVRLKEGTRFQAGDQMIAAASGLASGDEVRLVWVDSDSGQSAVINTFEIP